MPAYVIVEIDIHKPEEYQEYIKMTPPTLVPFEGKFIVRGGHAETLEEWGPKRIVILEFPSIENAKAWWSSELYAPAKALRQRTAHTRMIVVEGFTP